MNQSNSEIQQSGLLLTPQMAFAPDVNMCEEIVDAIPRMSPVQIQQEYYENLPDCDWVHYEKSNRNYLLQNIAFALFGGPSSEGELAALPSNQFAHLEGYTSRQKEQVMKIFQKVSEQSKYSQNNEDILLSVLLVVCAKPKPIKFYEFEPSNYWLDLHQRTDIDMWCTPVFRVRKCIPTTVGAKCCKVYIDDNGRVYYDWESYIMNNTQPKCVLIVPENGEYNGTIIEEEKAFAVRLTVVPSPTLGIKARVLSSADTASTVASIGALGVLGVAAFTPVGPAVLAGAAVASVATGVYGLMRSSLHLRDRSVHEQTISPTDAEARGSWLNIAASSVGLAAGAASNMLSRSAAAGTNLTKTGQALAVSVEVLRHANLVTGGAGVVNSLVHIISKYQIHGEKPTKLELFQFTAATLFFCNAVMSNRTAQSIIEEAQATTINNYRANLRSNRHRRIFDKLSAESRRTQGNVQGNTEVIRGIKNIVDKDQYFADVLRINKDVNEHKLRISMTADGNVNINSQHKFHPSQLANIAKEERTQLFTTLGPATVDSGNVPTRIVTSTTAIGPRINGEEESNIMVGIHPGEVLRIGTLLVRVSASGAENIALLLENLSQDVYANLMTVTFNMLSKLLPEEIAKLRLLSPEEDLIVQVVKFVFNYMKHERPLGDVCQETDNGICIVLKQFFQEGVVRQDTILFLKNRLMEWIDEEMDKRRQLYPSSNKMAEPQPPPLSAVEIQQQYYEAVGDADWELYEKKQRKYLLQKVAIALCGPPTKSGNLAKDTDNLELQGYELRDEEAIMTVFNKICEQSKYSHNGDDIIISTLRVVCLIPCEEIPFYKITPDGYWVNLHTKKEGVNKLIFHVFSLRKCVSTKTNQKSCRIFIDHDARVYQDWNDYLTTNNLPKCVMVVPASGEYRGYCKPGATPDSMPDVKLSVKPSPALGIGARVLAVSDGVSTVASVGGIVAIAGAIIVPAAAPVALGTALGIGLVTGVYGIARSTIRLVDRRKHDQSINLSDSEARGCWINIMVSTAGISFSAAGKILSWAAASGTNVKILMNAVTVLKYANFGTSALGVANSLGEMIYKYNKYHESPSGLEIFQFTTSVLFLGIGVMSNQTAQEIVQDAQAKSINEVRDSLSSNVKRKMFDKVTAETRRVKGSIQGNSDVIKALKNIENKDDFFAKISRINKDLNKNKLRISLAPDGNPLINNQHKINLSDMYGLGKAGRNQVFSEYGPANVTTKNVPTRIYPSNVSANGVTKGREENSNNLYNIRPEEIIRISNFIISLNSLDQEFVAEIISQLTATVHDAFLLVCAELVASLLPDEIFLLKSKTNSIHDYKVQMVLEVFNYLKSLIPKCDYKNDNIFVISLKEFVLDGRVKKDTILSLKKKIFLFMVSEKNNDSKNYDDIHKFRQTFSARFMHLRVGELINISQHKILIKNVTIEKLREWLESFSQEKCDVFIKICFRIISILTPAEINYINLINPDEDIIIRVSYFLLNETEIEIYFEEMAQDQGNICTSKAKDIKHSMIMWRCKQKLREHIVCKNCEGICFFKS